MGKYRSIVLAKLNSPPTLQMVRDIMIQSQELPGSIVQIPFGQDGSETYVLSVTVATKDGDSSFLWKMYRGDNADAPVEWSHVGDDTKRVFNYLTTRFPGWSQQSKMMTPEVQAFKNQLRTSTVTRPSQRSTLEGDLANMLVTNLLQSVAMNKMTGRLEIRDAGNEATVWFNDGTPVHSELPGASGDEALINLICWESGEFYFFPDKKMETRTVKKRMEILIMEGAIFHDLYTALTKLGFTFDSIVFRKNEALTETDFESTLSGGMPVDLELQKQIYCELSSKIPFVRLMEKLHLSKTQVVPIIFNLLSLDVVGLKKVIPSESSGAYIPFGDTPVVRAAAPDEETEVDQLDWHKVKKKTDIQALTSNPESSSMNFAHKIRELTGLDRPVQSNARVPLKGQGLAGFVVHSLFHPVLLLLMVVMTCLYLQEFRISVDKARLKNSNDSTKTSTQRGLRRYH